MSRSPTTITHTSMNQSTPKRKEPGNGKGKNKATVIDIIEISDDSDAESGSAAGAKRYHTPAHPRSQRKPLHSSRHANKPLDFGSPSRLGSKSAFRGLSLTPAFQVGPGASLSPSPSPCPSPRKSAATRGAGRPKPPAVSVVDVIEISSDEDERAASLLPSPVKGKQRAVGVDVDVDVDADTGVDVNMDMDLDPDLDIAPVNAQENPAHSDEDGGDIECGCCFAEYTFAKMVQCPDGHLFCAGCVAQYAATQLGAHNPSLVCMDTASVPGCTLAFPESELRRVLAPGLMALYARLGAQRAVAAAGLEGLEECPFCNWKCVVDRPIEDEDEEEGGLFRCGNGEGGCGVVSCRRCKKKDHRPKTCQEMEQDQVLNGQHTIEEAMTRALMRNCPNPKCNKAFIKEDGCNKMTCPYCRTYSCYVCRQMITGYDHFGRGGCPANDNLQNRHAMEVRDAAKKAAADLKLVNPDIDHAAINVDLPPSPAQLAARRQEQKLLALQRRREELADFFRRQESLRQEDLRRRGEREIPVARRERKGKGDGGEEEEEEEWVGEERRQQQMIAEQARRAAMGRQTRVGVLLKRDAGPVGGPPPASASASASTQSDPYARAYAHAFNMLHGGENGGTQ